MFIVLLKVSDNKDAVDQFMPSHQEWLKKGFDEGVFLLAGGIKPNLGGCILVHNSTLEELEKRVSADPFVVENVVRPEIIEISPVKADERLNFLLSGD